MLSYVNIHFLQPHFQYTNSLLLNLTSSLSFLYYCYSYEYVFLLSCSKIAFNLLPI